MKNKIYGIYKIIKCDGWSDELGFEDADDCVNEYPAYDDAIGELFQEIIEREKLEGKEIMLSYIIHSRGDLTEEELVKLDIYNQIGNPKASFEYDEDNRYGYSSRTIMGYTVDENDFTIGGHSMKEELQEHVGKFIYLTLSYD